MKYIIVSNDFREYPIMFPSDFVHKHMAGAVQGLLGGTVFLKPVSAGDYDPATGQCTGCSETLKLTSRPQDEDIIRLYNYQHGIIL